MAGLRLTLRAEPSQRLDLSIVTPDGLAGLSEEQIARLPIGTTREAAFIGEVFTLRMGDPAEIVIEGGSARFDRVGAGMATGTLRLDGEAGAYAGQGMRGGELLIAGDAGPFLASPAPGERTGIAGGSIVVRGNAGPGAAIGMRRGTVVIEGSAGPDLGRSIIAGTLIVCGQLSSPPGRFMRRGSILLGHSVALGPTFAPTGAAADAFLRLLARFLQPVSPPAAALAAMPLRRGLGDLAAGGKGEIFFPAA